MACWMACGPGSWKPLLVTGIIFLFLGGILFVFPGESLRIAIFLAGVLAFMAGIGLFIGAWILSRSGGMLFVVPLILGICAVLLGAVSFTDPGTIGAFAAVLLGILMVVAGLSGTISAVFHPGSGIRRLVSAAGGVVLAALGVLILLSPRLSGLVIVRIIGGVMIAVGVIALAGSVMLAIRERSCAPLPGFERLERF